MKSTTKWAIEKYKVTVNGNAFFGNGVSYSPVPWGGCTAFVPYGDFTIETWKSVWQRDLELMRSNGVNLLKTYNTLDAAQLIAGGDPETWDHDHTEFLNTCWNDGNNPIYVLMGYAPPKNQQAAFLSSSWQNQSNVDMRATIKANFIELAKSWGAFPAVMGFVMANELNADNVVNNPLFFEYWNDVAIAIGNTAPGKLTSLANVDDSMITVNAGNQYMLSGNFFWGYNSYRGNWTNSNGFDNLFSTFQDATASNPVPLMLTEWGAPASTHDANGNMTELNESQMNNLVTYITGHYNNIVLNRSDIGSGVCCGGTYFEWSDEWWKADPDGTQCNQPNAAPTCNSGVWNPGPNMNVQPNYPGNYWDEEGFGLFSIAPVSPSTRKPVTEGGCPGPWNPETNSPYAPDTLTARPHAKALFTAMSSLGK
ncbi:hypothetical protein JI750_21835 [Flavobacterium sp. GN10]|uniref:Glycoside hydrolase family 5 domain-containing protein n=1 Tax=Flavobacterium tagetis TaxID=2801336 RepID=A0ABS1KJB7_9FLAO|nr:hypothetical protein [Flavobacterium tagetis]MBL0739548.1 hypothetical protein [Flavobacterium tagetis]